MQTLAFYLSLAAFLVSLGSGIYFFAWWAKSGRQHRLLLWWAFGSGSLLLFKIPNILAHAQVKISQEKFYPFFFITLLAYFLAYFALARGFAFFTEFSHGKLIVGLFGLWFVAAAAYLASAFLVPGIGVANAPVWMAHLLFYIPVQMFLFYELWRVKKRPSGPVPVPNAGVVCAGAGVALLFITSILYISVQIGPYPREFWYVSVLSSQSISLLQIASGILLLFGLRVFAQSHIRKVQ